MWGNGDTFNNDNSFWDQVYQDFVSSERGKYIEPSVNQPEIIHQEFEEGDFPLKDAPPPVMKPQPVPCGSMM
jgi:hypothetical protein